MQQQGEAWVEIIATADRALIAELALVLEARAIPFATDFEREEYRLAVRAEDVPGALEEWRDYQAENAGRRGGARKIDIIGSGWAGVLCYVAVLLATAILARQSTWGLDWLGAGRADSAAIVAGEWWRAVTALSLHVDTVHLLGNIAFGSFFGYFVGRYLGTGVGWFSVLLTGAFGNIVNAFLQAPDHRSIGASTAVFAALGILSAFTWRRGFFRGTPWRTRFAPVTAGIALLAFTGTAGENTDLGAHLFGFVAGFAAGAALAGIALPRGVRIQAAFGGVSIGVFVAGWAAALYA